MAEPRANDERALVEISPEVLARLREPRVVLAFVFAVAGAVAEIAGYWGVSATIQPGEQLPYIISGGIGGLFLLGAAAALVLSVDLQALKTRVRESAADNRLLAEEVRARRWRRCCRRRGR